MITYKTETVTNRTIALSNDVLQKNAARRAAATRYTKVLSERAELRKELFSL